MSTRQTHPCSVALLDRVFRPHYSEILDPSLNMECLSGYHEKVCELRHYIKVNICLKLKSK